MRNYQVQNVYNIPLKTLLAIKENGFRSKDCTVDYCPFEVDLRIIELQESKATKQMMTQAESDAIDYQLLALLESHCPGQYLLNLIDNALMQEITMPYGDECQYDAVAEVSLKDNKIVIDYESATLHHQDGIMGPFEYWKFRTELYFKVEFITAMFNDYKKTKEKAVGCL